MNQEEILLSIVSTSLLMLILIVIIAIAFVISARQKLKQEMLLAETKLQYEQELRQVENEVSEQMMNRLSQELHDNIGQLHTAMHIQIQNQKLDHPELKERFETVEAYLGEATRQLKILSRTLNYDYLGHAGLLNTLDVEVERLKNLKRPEVIFIKEGSLSPLTKNQQLVVFRMFQEITQNALRHSGASKLDLSLNCSETEFTFTIRDNGKGFDVENTLASAKSNGLLNIFKRAELAGLNVKLESKLGKGTTFELTKI
jgi:signal transduction histidine kinase